MSKRHRKARQAEPTASLRFISPERDVPDMLGYLRLIAEARAELNAFQDHWVHCLMACGVTLAQIGEALGVTKQSVHARYSGSVRPVGATKDGVSVWTSLGASEAPAEGAVKDR